MPMRIKTHGQLEKKHRPGIKPDDRLSPSLRGYGRRWHKVRNIILQRDRYICQMCDKPAGKSAHVDHIVSKANGGSDMASNLQTLCRPCHSRKTVNEDGGFGGA